MTLELELELVRGWPRLVERQLPAGPGRHLGPKPLGVEQLRPGT